MGAPASDDAVVRQLTTILDTAVDGLITIDERGTVQTFNSAAERLFGYDRNEVIGKNVSMLMSEPHSSRHDAYLANYLRTGQRKIIGIGREELGRRKDGTTFPIELAISEVLQGGRRTFTGMVRDISCRKQLEAQVLKVSEREQQRIGHELHDGLCQELAGIAFVVQSLQQKAQKSGSADPSGLAKVTTMLQEAVRHARGLAHGLYPVDPQPNGLRVALAQLAINVGDMFKIRCEFRGESAVDLDDPTTATHLYRIAQEAVRDAIRHGKADRIVIELTGKRNSIVLTVADNGFDPTIDGRYHEEMVLAMMQHRAKVIGAKLKVASRPGGGASVVCEIPIRK